MKILEREFTGPLKVEYQTLPKASGIYVITHIHKGQIKPLFIGFTKDIKHRVHSLLIQGPIPKENLNDDELKLFYLLYDDEHYLEGQRFERELIEIFEPTFNSNIFQNSKSNWTSLSDSKVERTRKFSSIVAAIASTLAIAATIPLLTDLIFDKKNDIVISNLPANNKAFIDYSKAINKFENTNKDIEAIKLELKTLSTKPSNANWSVEAGKFNQRISLIESKLTALEEALTVDPAKSLAIPLLRKDLDNTQSAFKIELAQSKSEVDRVYD